MYMSSRMPITSAMKETMLAVSRTVSPWAIWLLPSSRSWTVSPSRLQAQAKLKRVRVELSRKMLTARPLSKIRAERLFRRMPRRMSATAKTARSSSSVFSQVSRKSERYIPLAFRDDNRLMASPMPTLSISLAPFPDARCLTTRFSQDTEKLIVGQAAQKGPAARRHAAAGAHECPGVLEVRRSERRGGSTPQVGLFQQTVRPTR